jgi:ornithine cyclodeaminase/alanine dehydrogenase-like protein (mu-crystallin family)
MTAKREPILWLRERDVTELVSLSDAIGALEALLPLEGKSEAVNAPKSLIALAGNAGLHSLSSALMAQRYCGTKTWINAPAGAMAIYTLFDSQNGSVLSIMEANALGSLRTAGIAALATRQMGPRETNDVVIIGAGRQAFLQAAALTTALGLKRLRIFNRTRERQRTFAEKLERDFDVTVSCPMSLEEALDGASIVTVVTRASEPFIPYEMLSNDVHINALGAILPTHAELQPSVLAHADLIVVDNVANARQASRELREFCSEPAAWGRVETLGQFIGAGKKRLPGMKLTVFKSLGMGLSDLAIAVRAYEAARGCGSGMPIEYPAPASFHWTEKMAKAI